MASAAGVIYATGADHHVVALDLSTGEVKSKFDAGKHPISCLAIAPGKPRFLHADKCKSGGAEDG